MFRNPANKNYLEAQTLIGVDYLNGNGVTQDYAKAIEWFQKAVSEDYAPAQNMLGYMYKHGNGVIKNYSEAVEWFQKAADQGFDEGLINLALMYSKGEGVQKDYTKALEICQKLAEQGNLDAQNLLDKILKEAQDISVNNEVNDCVDSIAFDSELSIPFRDFFNGYFRDEAGKVPLNTGGGVWFLESMNTDEILKFGEKSFDIRQKSDYSIDFLGADLIIDSTVTKNFSAGLFLDISEKGYCFYLKNSAKDWKIIDQVKSAEFSKYHKKLRINSYEINLSSDNARLYGERLIDCINAYLNQNDIKSTDKEIFSSSKPITNALDNIDDRLAEIQNRLTILQNQDAA